MSAIENLNTAVSNLTSEVSKATTAITGLKKQIADLQAIPSQDVAIQVAADAVVAQTSTLDASIQ